MKKLSQMMLFAFCLSTSFAFAGGEDWKLYKVGDKVEVDTVCSGSWWPATITVVEANGPKHKKYTVKRTDGSEWSFNAPGYVAPCVRSAGGIAKERAQFPAPKLGVYNCNYRGQVTPVFDFALLDKDTYRDYDGKRGAYKYDSTKKQLLFVSGPKKGSVFQQMTALSFQFLDEKGEGTGNHCPLNPNRDPNGKKL